MTEDPLEWHLSGVWYCADCKRQRQIEKAIDIRTISSIYKMPVPQEPYRTAIATCPYCHKNVPAYRWTEYRYPKYLPQHTPTPRTIHGDTFDDKKYWTNTCPSCLRQIKMKYIEDLEFLSAAEIERLISDFQKANET